MKRLELIRKPEIFQGEKYLNTNKNYFEGWYFKNTNGKKGISFIPGIHINHTMSKAFIQVITSQSSYYIDYDIKDYQFNQEPFFIKIGNNTFSKKGINIDIEDKSQNLKIYGNIQYSNSKNIHTNFIKPNIMGPFSYIPSMECNHAILSMENTAQGCININQDKITFEQDIGYIEKDWGSSFPKSYIWCQGNNFKKEKASFMLSIANIPFKIFQFRGIICALLIGDKEFKFTTYNGSKIQEYDSNRHLINITLKRGRYSLNIKAKNQEELKLTAPIKGKMEKEIFESISSVATVTLKRKDKVIFCDTSTNCGLEIVE